MAARATVPPARRRMLVAGLGVLLLLYALTTVWFVVNSGPDVDSGDREPLRGGDRDRRGR